MAPQLCSELHNQFDSSPLKTGHDTVFGHAGLPGATRWNDSPPLILVTSLKPDIFIFNRLSQEVIVFELTCPWDTNINRSHNFKAEKYAPLIADLASRFVVSFFSVEVSARGQINKENRCRLKSFLFKCCSYTGKVSKALIGLSSKTALLSSYNIFAARREPTWEDPAPLTVQL